jgi:hypothetical protein
MVACYRPKLPSGSLAVTRLLTRSDYERVNEMTTDNTTATTASTAAEENMTPFEFADNFIKNHSTLEIAEQLVTYSEQVDRLQARVTAEAGSSDHWRQKFNRLEERVAEFLKSHISENDDASVDDMKEFAESLGIELTKNITVKFTAEVEVEMTVPLDFDCDDISEDSFTVSAEFDGMTDVEVEDTNINVNDFEVEED